MSIIDLILPKTAVPRKRPQSYLITSLYQGTLPYRYCSKFQSDAVRGGIYAVRYYKRQ